MARVLIIDGLEADRRRLQAALNEEHTCDCAEDERAGLFLLTASPWDVVVLDPEGATIDCSELMRRIREKDSPPEVVVTTTEQKLDAVVQTLRAGAFEFVPKPVNDDALRKAVTNAAQLKRLRDDKRQLEIEQRKERRELAALVEERTHQMQQVFRNVPGMLYRMLVTSHGHRRFSFISQSCLELLELAEEPLLQDAYRLDALVHPDDAPRFRRDRALAEEHTERFRFEGRFILASGRTRWLQCIAHPTLRVDGGAVWDGIVIDVTERNELESQLLLADRLSSVGNMAAAVAHEVNNPLAFLKANLTELRARLSDGDQERLQLVHEALEGAERIEIAVKDLRTFARSTVESVKLVDITQVMDSSIRLASNEIRHRARLEKSYQTGRGVLADESNLGQLFLNLLISMAQTIPEGEAQQHQICVRIWDASDGRVCIELTDNGPGLPDEVLERAFEPVTHHKSRNDPGLYVCHRIVTSLRGQISAGRAPTGGTRFRISLPMANTASNVVPFPRISRGTKRPARVLVVDDEELVIKALCRALEGHEVCSARSGREAIELLQHQPPFDLVLCDVMMPDLTGADVYDAARRVGSEHLIVFVTGGAFTSGAQAFLESVPNRRIEKPFSRDSVLALLEHLPR